MMVRKLFILISIDLNEFQLYTRSTLQLGIGIFYFFISLIPKSFMWIIKAIGFKANRMKGIKFLHKNFLETGHRSPISGLLLFWIECFYFEDKEESEKYFRETLENIEECPFYYYLGGYLKRKGGEIDQSIELFLLVNKLTSEIRIFQLSSIYELGWCYYLKLEWNQCIDYFEEFLSGF